MLKTNDIINEFVREFNFQNVRFLKPSKFRFENVRKINEEKSPIDLLIFTAGNGHIQEKLNFSYNFCHLFMFEDKPDIVLKSGYQICKIITANLYVLTLNPGYINFSKSFVAEVFIDGKII